MRVIRMITYESDSVTSLRDQIRDSLSEGSHKPGKVWITVKHMDGPIYPSRYPFKVYRHPTKVGYRKG